MSDSYRIRLGIEPPERRPEVALTCDQMRIAIDKAARDSHLIRTCLDTARYTGKSGEDSYVLLAYKALLVLEVAHRSYMGVCERTIKPVMQPIPLTEIGERVWLELLKKDGRNPDYRDELLASYEGVKDAVLKALGS